MDYLSRFTTTSSAAKYYCNRFNVPRLAEGPNLALALFGCSFFFAAQAASRYCSRRLFPKIFKSLDEKTRNDWDLHFVSRPAKRSLASVMVEPHFCEPEDFRRADTEAASLTNLQTGWVHALISAPIALYLIWNPSPQLVRDPIFGYAPLEGAVFAFSGGYFLYDLLVSLAFVKSHGIPFVVHATSCCFIFFKAFTPFLNGIGPTFLIWELSTIFLHPHWWLDKLNMTGSTLQLANGVALLSAFFGARIVYGGLMTYRLWNLLDAPNIDPKLRWGFRAANLALNILNWSWFILMILSVYKRLGARERDAKGGKGKKTVQGKKVD
ncbi:BZ3500_MvSof-1268-A1-R1_Chr6-3g08725 [Microbotryum saponariae]|uniref:BZ3500_MvSof-1268-A1-R1_Chr6-3g08725 protein n=1 Tax=Microbotryum saponariae TaxID=289078 RepID=A0A2X0KNI6_9BASI|nr:BZ3500_MvSof-1268-A1-R1_Chr6-3g08725 [Microbotryum saponariae]SDA07326.1 BZ3501_MvSof-1269-A2-R1_Chr6-2g08428 [Microbotryum saponariae]